jgi:hypothetical protein
MLGRPGARGPLTQLKETFQIPKTWSSLAGSSAVSAPSESPAVATVVPLNHIESGCSSGGSQVMTKLELSTVTQASVTFLNNRMRLHADEYRRITPNSDSDAHFVHHLITATLCLGLAPRSQVLQQLRIGSSFTRRRTGSECWPSRARMATHQAFFSCRANACL